MNDTGQESETVLVSQGKYKGKDVWFSHCGFDCDHLVIDPILDEYGNYTGWIHCLVCGGIADY